MGAEVGYVLQNRRYKEPTLKSAETCLALKIAESKKVPLITLNC